MLLRYIKNLNIKLLYRGINIFYFFVSPKIAAKEPEHYIIIVIDREK